MYLTKTFILINDVVYRDYPIVNYILKQNLIFIKTKVIAYLVNYTFYN